MARSPKHHIIPETSRVCVTLGASEIKELRKIGIDLEMPDQDVLHLAVRVLIERYRQLSPEIIQKRGAEAFPFNSETHGQGEE